MFKRVAANTAWNIFGQLLPLIAALVAIPQLIGQIGLERFGFVSIAWVLVGYASIFDFGVGKALIRTVSAHLLAERATAADSSARTALTLLIIFGVMTGIGLAALSAWLVDSILHVPEELAREALMAMYILSASLPVVMLSTGYIGIISAHEQFRRLNIVRAVLGVVSYVFPVLTAFHEATLPAVVGAVVAIRVLGAVAFRALCRRYAGMKISRPVLDRTSAIELVQLGGWMSVSNIISPLMTYLDRLLLSAVVPMREVAFYATPFDLISRLMILPYAAMAALFPQSAGVQPGSAMAVAMVDKSMRALAVLMFPPLLIAAAFAHPALAIWLGEAFADRAAPVLQLLAVGVLFNSLAQAPATLIQSAGQPRVLAQLQLLELPVFLLGLWFLTTKFGIVGTAMAAALRSTLDATAVYTLAAIGPARGLALTRRWLPTLFLFIACVLGVYWVRGWLACAVVGLGGTFVFLVLAWLTLVDIQERDTLRALLPMRIWPSQ